MVFYVGTKSSSRREAEEDFRVILIRNKESFGDPLTKIFNDLRNSDSFTRECVICRRKKMSSRVLFIIIAGKRGGTT